jgi:hypothetical protein
VEEAGCNQRDVNCEYAYGIRGMTPLHTMPFRGAPSGQRNSAIAAMSTRGVEDFCLVEGPVNGAIILEFVQNSLVSIVKPFNGENDQIYSYHQPYFYSPN